MYEYSDIYSMRKSFSFVTLNSSIDQIKNYIYNNLKKIK